VAKIEKMSSQRSLKELRPFKTRQFLLVFHAVSVIYGSCNIATSLYHFVTSSSDFHISPLKKTHSKDIRLMFGEIKPGLP